MTTALMWNRPLAALVFTTGPKIGRSLKLAQFRPSGG